MTDRFEQEVDTTHANDLWQQEVADNLARRAAHTGGVIRRYRRIVSYVEAAVPVRLRGLAECMWVVRGPRRARILPDGCMDLIEADGAVVVAGPDTRAFISDQPCRAGTAASGFGRASCRDCSVCRRRAAQPPRSVERPSARAGGRDVVGGYRRPAVP